MIIEYDGTTIEVTRAAVKAWVEGQAPEDWAGMTCDGEQCLLHNYIMARLPRRPFVFVGPVNIAIGSVSYPVDDEVGVMIDAFDGADPDKEGRDFTYGEVLERFAADGVW